MPISILQELKSEVIKMGLSATQMRFLMVTARKSNVEYQGQQINQARTGLANQSSQLYSELMTLKAPTAPSVYKYVINPTEKPTIDWSATEPLLGVDMENFLVHYAGNQAQFQDFNIPEYVATTQVIAGETVTGWHKYLGKDEETGEKKYGEFLTDEQFQAKIDAKDETFCYQAIGKDAAGNEVNYTAISVDKNANYTYDISSGLFVPKDGYTSTDLDLWLQMFNTAVSQYSIYSKPKKSAIYDINTTGEELTKLKNADSNDDPEPIAYQSTATVSYNQAQYDAALVQYEEDLEEYNKACDEINAKIEEIHESDKKLELQLKQLDTEQEAIQTEYDALKKVLDKNIENTFKTFG